MEIVAIIPARGGSKRIPRKNLKPICGRPLISYSIVEARKSRYVKRVIVSTEDEEIARVSELYGAQVLRRPAELARDETPTIDVVLHVLDALRKNHYQPEVIVLLQPTSPFRLAKDIDDAIHLFLTNECESVVSVCEVKYPPFWSLSIEDGYLKPFFREEFLGKRKQELPKLYVPNEAIYVSSPQAL